MKKFSALLGLLLCVCGGHAQTSRVNGNYLSPNDTIYYLYYNMSDRTRDAKDQVKIYAPGGKFSFELPENDAVYTILMCPGAVVEEEGEAGAHKLFMETLGSLFTFMVFPGEQVEVVRRGNSVDFYSPTYAKYGSMRPVLERYRAEAKRCDLAGLQDSVKAYNEMARKTVLDYIKAHPDDPFSAFLIDKEVPNADARDAYNMLYASLREDKIGAYVSEAVKRKEAKALAAVRVKEARSLEEPQREAAEKVYSSASKKKLEAGDAFPGLSFTDMGGKEFSLDSLKGKYVYIDVWATWCAPCKGELPYLKRLEESLAGKNIAFVSISADADRVAWEEMVKKEGLGGVQLYAGGAKNAFCKFFGIYGFPHFILLDREGKVLNTDMSRPSHQETETALRALEGI